ncbi:esterase family protein [Gordonia sp. HNM0687]|uniref:Esterase family protein n=2 Tax=Gordonia mangrovi TaxID=2665643 RepID=A0A6L7GM46_9ACTN|nr:esterase family protein [Gordonia mangrovi]
MTPRRRARRSARVGQTVFVTVLLALTLTQLGAGTAAARDREGAATVTGLTQVDGALWEMTVDSPTMGSVPFQVIRPNGAPAGAPTLYLLNGAGGGEDGANWLAQTDAQQFFADKFVNVVIPARGLGSYYTDWIAADPRMGQPMWATFLTDELPAAVDHALAGNGRNAIAGLSMSATSVLDLATIAPGLYRSVAAYSGCARTSTPEGEAAVRGIVYAAAGGDADNMWGPSGSPLWRQHDPYLNAEKLRGTRLYLSSGSGTPGRYDTPSAQAPGAPPIANQILVGGALEAATRACTEAMAKRLRQLSIPAQVHLPSAGTHSWGYWEDELHRSWPTLAAGLDD